MTGTTSAAGLLCGSPRPPCLRRARLSPARKAGTQVAEPHKKCAREEAVYINRPPRSGKVFLSCGRDRERDLFHRGLRKQRDPRPVSDETNSSPSYSATSLRPTDISGRTPRGGGWGRPRPLLHHSLGEPRESRVRGEDPDLRRAEIWYLIRGKTGLGLPAGFNLVFFRRAAAGIQALQPVGHGPQALLSTISGGGLPSA